VFQGELRRQMSAEGLHTIALRGVMARSDKMNTLFSGRMHGLF
jgi:hypothetical protein